MSESSQATLDRSRSSHVQQYRRPEDAELRGLVDVAMVKAADFWTLHDRPRRGTLNRPEVGCVFVEREMCTRLMVIGEVASQDVARCRSPRTNA
jgi:hypothetical protein